MQAPRWNPSTNAASKAKPGPTTSARTTRAASTVCTRMHRATTAPEAMAVPGRHARELAALRAEYEERLESLRTDCQMQLAALATTLRAEHQANIAAVTTTLQQEHQEALAASDAKLRQEHSIKELALTTELATLAAQHDANLERARIQHTRSEGLQRDLHTLAKLNHRLQTTMTAEAATTQKIADEAHVAERYTSEIEGQLHQATADLAAATDAIAALTRAATTKDNLAASLQATLELTTSNLAHAEHTLDQTKRDLATSKTTEDDNAIRLRDATSTIQSMGERIQMLQADLDGHEQRSFREASAKDNALVLHQDCIDELLGQLAVAKMAAGSAQLLHEATIETKDKTIRCLHVDLDDGVQQAKTLRDVVDQLKGDLIAKRELLATRDDQIRNIQAQLDAAKAQMSTATTTDRSAQVVSAVSINRLAQVLQLAQSKIQATKAECQALLATNNAIDEDAYDGRHHHPRISVHRVNKPTPRR
ncbi:hypothetical protein SDRG_16820 [Saprolegnia diclina VS20]|uniref:Uncharacterized protein n=1 Tax=Saprolegnia diclina (strain VS20) TaxID=1156394 RepID=T0R726_SAPDV|nr:hypothetical protein SDRG_16820 [Saprolegnia diclina VS20]EQC25297.1 hypothetical protein SDRG_16820 [Saprolegnia diclina VS20]|eukprot:XP_008621263.1 hypothetical protein SDRG_16820 [Saprolegnia diclina VS20]